MANTANYSEDYNFWTKQMYFQSLGGKYRVKVSPGPASPEDQWEGLLFPRFKPGMQTFWVCAHSILGLCFSSVYLDLFLIHLSYKDNCCCLEDPPAWVRMTPRWLMMSTKGISPSRKTGAGSGDCNTTTSFRFCQSVTTVCYSFQEACICL